MYCDYLIYHDNHHQCVVCHLLWRIHEQIKDIFIQHLISLLFL